MSKSLARLAAAGLTERGIDTDDGRSATIRLRIIPLKIQEHDMSRTYVVTGAASGIGATTAHTLRGDDIWSRNDTK